MQRLASDMNKSKRQLFLSLLLLIWATETTAQVITCKKTFVVGFLPRIRGKITTLPVKHATMGPQRGSFGASRFQIGNLLVQVPFYGSTGSVSGHLSVTL